MVPDCDEPDHHHEYNGYRSSICRGCYFDVCACEEDAHEVSECLEDKDCPNHTKTIEYFDNWPNYDYHWKEKK